MDLAESLCPNCKELFWASDNKLFCPKCEGWKDISIEKTKQLQKSINSSLKILDETLKELSFFDILRKSLNLLENTAKKFLFNHYNLETKLSLLTEWIKYSLLTSLIIRNYQKMRFLISDTEVQPSFFFILDLFVKDFISLLKLNQKNVFVFQKGNEEIILIPPSKPIINTPESVLKKQIENTKLDMEINFARSFSQLDSYIDVNFFPSQFYNLTGTYLSHSLGLPKYLVTSEKKKAKQLLDIYSILNSELVKLPITNTHIFTQKNFINAFGEKIFDDMQIFINCGGFQNKEIISWSPNIFLKILSQNEETIIPLVFSNLIIEQILQVKTGRTKLGRFADLKGLSYEVEIFGYCETLNVTGELNGKQLIRIPNPIKSSKMKELADIIFLGNKTNNTYVISAKTHPVLTLKSLQIELEKYHKEQVLIKQGLEYLGINTKNINWLFITPITWLHSFKNIKIFNIMQLIAFISNKEGIKEVTLQNEEETLSLADLSNYGNFVYENRGFCIEICKIHDIRNDEIAIWIYKPQVHFTLLRIDIPKFIDIKHLRKGEWLKILIEFRTKYSTQIASYHDSEPIEETKAHAHLMKREIFPPYP